MDVQPTLKKIDVLTLFPRMAEGFLEESILGQAHKNKILDIKLHNLRNWANNPHKSVDDKPFGGGAGMLLSPEPLVSAIESLKNQNSYVIYLCPDGKSLNTQISKDFTLKEHLILISGHYEGIDQRVRDHWVDLEISIGDFVLTNGTLPACVLIDSLTRYLPGVLGKEKSLTSDSFKDNLLSYPQYTRPSNFHSLKVPEVLLSGDHNAIAQWRKQQAYKKTQQRRPDLLS